MWEPKKYLFDDRDGTPILYTRIDHIIEKLRGARDIISSHDFPDLRSELSIKDMPDGFSQIQVPVILHERSALFMTTAEPDSYFPNHVHKEVNLFRLVVSGSIIANGKELGCGDWMYVPAGIPYWIRAGKSGATIVHSYGPDRIQAG